MRLEATEGGAANELRELSSGVDALYMTARADLSDRLVSDLERWKLNAAGSAGVAIELLGEEFRFLPRAWGKYPYAMEHEFGLIGFTSSTKLPAINVQPRATHLHAFGPDVAVEWWADLVHALTGTDQLSASRLDLYSDWQGWQIGARDVDQFVCRASRRDTHEDAGRLTGFEFGRRAKTICARIYDKTVQTERKGREFWTLMWGSRFDSADRVMRVEFEIGRAALRQFRVDTATEAVEAGAAIWGALSEGWLTHREPTNDTTKSRWPLSAAWRQIQQPSFRAEIPGLERSRRANRASSLRGILPALMGYTSSFAALSRVESLDETMELLPGALRDYALTTPYTFEERVREKARWLA